MIYKFRKEKWVFDMKKNQDVYLDFVPVLRTVKKWLEIFQNGDFHINYRISFKQIGIDKDLIRE